jgi:hypothetical protein
MKNPIHAIFCAALFAAATGAPARAMVDDAHSAAMEAAAPAVKKGFKVREEYWSGQVKSGEPTAVKCQLYKGNEYWFWLGCADEDITLTIEMYDVKGNKVSVESISAKDAAGIRIVPPKTGTYVAIFTITHKKDPKAKLDWALAYGYR